MVSPADELSNFFLAEDRWQAMGLFWIGSVCDAPIPSESLGVEEPQGRQTDSNHTRRPKACLSRPTVRSMVPFESVHSSPGSDGGACHRWFGSRRRPPLERLSHETRERSWLAAFEEQPFARHCDESAYKEANIDLKWKVQRFFGVV
jgi:hypothetical protein